jgi:hypothetical protein
MGGTRAYIAPSRPGPTWVSIAPYRPGTYLAPPCIQRPISTIALARFTSRFSATLPPLPYLLTCCPLANICLPQQSMSAPWPSPCMNNGNRFINSRNQRSFAKPKHLAFSPGPSRAGGPARKRSSALTSSGFFPYALFNLLAPRNPAAATSFSSSFSSSQSSWPCIEASCFFSSQVPVGWWGLTGSINGAAWGFFLVRSLPDVPRTVLFDLEPGVINAARAPPLG